MGLLDLPRHRRELRGHRRQRRRRKDDLSRAIEGEHAKHPPCARREAPESDALLLRRGRLPIVDDDEKVVPVAGPTCFGTDHDVEVSVEPAGLSLT